MLTPAEQQRREALRRSKPLAHEKIMRYDERYARGESVAVVQLQYDYSCNMFCEHCSISGFRKPHERRALDPASVKDLCDQAHEYGLAQIDLTGGEPLIFPDLEEVIAAIGPERFYLMVDTNGWTMTPDKARRLKALGVDKVQVGIDNLDARQHDLFRRRQGAHERAMKAMDAVLDAGLVLQVSTVITPERIRSDEFRMFLGMMREKGAIVNSIWAKATGEYEQRPLTVTAADEALRVELCQEFPNLTPPHTHPRFGMHMGCIAWKKIIAINKFGDVMPCIWIYYSLGNIFEEPLRKILERGAEYFGAFHGTCRTNRDEEFMAEYREATRGRELPIRIEEVRNAECGVRS